ncbi:MAG TPA: tRNA lysidine(34) synthetase TilS [Actinomycetota bacterium]|nr:tRNA lysidine(34) synthetase TilS [Actinomycetota bacterium]
MLAAYSGGPDSTALALILRSLGYRVTLGHVDHGMRPGSAADAAQCRVAARSLGLPIEVARLGPPPTGEAAARSARYAALEELRRRVGASAIATGHTLDDDAETVLLRQARGGFPLGIPPRRGNVVRPLLAVRRPAAAALCAERGIPVLTDPSNADESFARNRIRRRVLPQLGDAGIEALAALGARSRQAAGAREAEAGRLLAGLRHGPAGSGEIRLDQAGLSALPGELQRPVLRRFLGEVGIDPTTRLIDALCCWLAAGARGSVDLPGGYAARAELVDLVVAQRSPAVVLLPASLPVPGHTVLPAWGMEATVELLAPPEGLAVPDRRWSAILDAGAVGTGPLALRSRRDGDRYRPLGAPGGRKLQDLFVDAKILRAERDRVPVLTCAGQVAWVAGFRIDERFGLTPASREAIRVTLRPAGPDPRG